MLKPLTVAVTAHLRIAPIAMRTIEVPMLISAHFTPCAYAQSPAGLAQLSLHVAGHLAFADRFAFVIEVFTPSDRDLHLGPRPRPPEVDPGRHQGEPALVGPPLQA